MRRVVHLAVQDRGRGREGLRNGGMSMSDFKHGDRVTSPLLVGEWLIYGTMRGNLPPDWVWLIRADEKTGDVIPEFAGRLTLVAPPLPPEPPVGSVVFCPNDGDPRDGEWFACMRFDHGGWLDSWGNPGRWADIAADARPAVPQPTVDEVLDALHAAQHDKHATNLSLGVALHAALWPEVPGE